MLEYRPYFIMKLTCASIIILLSFLPILSYSQSESQLRDPEFLIGEYNQLVAKHNALIEKTRVLITQTKSTPSTDLGAEEELRQSLNEALAKAATLENQLSKIKQAGLRTDTSNH